MLVDNYISGTGKNAPFYSVIYKVGRTWDESTQTAYYNFLHEIGFLTGNARNKPKDAREKTSGLVALGLIDDNRRLTEVGVELLKLSEQNNFSNS